MIMYWRANCKFDVITSIVSRVSFHLGVSNPCKDADCREKEKCKRLFYMFLLTKYEMKISAAYELSILTLPIVYII